METENETNRVASLPAKKRNFDALSTTTEEFATAAVAAAEELAAMSRSERKRHREKKRRSDVNKGFDDLMALLLEIDPEVRAEAEERANKGLSKRSLGAHEDNVLSRVDLIATAVKVLKRVHVENEKHKKIVEDLIKDQSDAIRRNSAALANHNSAAGSALASLSSGNFGSPLLDHHLRHSALLGLGGASAAASQAVNDSVAQQQLRALMLSSAAGTASASAAQSQLAASSAVLALRAAAANGGRHSSFPTTAAASDAGLLAQLTAGSTSGLNRNFLQSLLQSNNPVVTAGSAESLYGALGPLEGTLGRHSQQKDESEQEQIRKLRAAAAAAGQL